VRPHFKLLSDELIRQIIDEALALLMDPGVRVENAEALDLLADAGVGVNREAQIAHIPEDVARSALEVAPSEFDLYDLDGKPAVHYGAESVQFTPGSGALMLLDGETQEHREPVTGDLVRFVKLVEQLPQLDAQSTAFICTDVPKEIGDLYRLYLALNYMRKPIVTGAFRKDTWWTMKEMLVAVAGGEVALAEQPVAIFDVCPSPPLMWSDLTCQNLIDCARHGIPSELISMPMAGATAPVTLAGAVVQHTAESLSGVVICQLAAEGAPIVWGGSPAVFDMRKGTTPMGAVGTWMIDVSCTEVGKALALPTHVYLSMSDAKIVDAQCGLESAGSTLVAALAGVNMVAGAGMMDFESCQSCEKLVIDAEIIGMAKHLIAGVEVRDDPIGLELIRKMGHRGNYLGQRHTLEWFDEEQYIPSAVIDRGSLDAWKRQGSTSAWERAQDRVTALLDAYQLSPMSDDLRSELRAITLRAAETFGMDELPPLPDD
jgi:trimethylamine--corrinoid protein Co-methyltransferase